MLVILVAIHPYPSPQAVPLGNAFLLGYRQAHAPRHSPLRVRLCDFFLQEEARECAAALAAQKPALVGFSTYVWNRERCRDVAAGLRRLLPGVRLFAGGPEASADPVNLMAEGVFDFLVVGDGEETFAELCTAAAAGAPVEAIPGIATLPGEGLRLTPRAPLEELDAIPSPWLSGVLDPRDYRGLLWQLSRGCGFSCAFCFDSRGGSGVRRFSLERVEAELRLFAAAEVPQVFVLDSTFNQDGRRAKQILRLIARIAPRTHFHFEVRSEFIDREMAKLFGEIPCSLQIGLQSADPRVLAGVGRSFRRRDFEEKVGLLNRSGAVFGFDLMYGLPDDSLDRFRESLDFALGLYPNHLDIFPLAILPGTLLAARSHSLGLRHLPAPPYTLLSSPTFGERELAEAGRLALACDVFYTRGRGVAWFNSVIAALGLTPSAFLDRFALWLAERKGDLRSEEALGDDEIWSLQRSFLTRMFGPKKLKPCLPLVLDLVDYHHHYAAALLTPPADAPDDDCVERMALPELPARLAPAARLVRLNYEILDILQAGEPDVRSFSRQAARCGSWVLLYPAADGVRTESLIEPYFRLLQRLDGRTPCGAIAASLGIPAPEALSFLRFAAAEGVALFHEGG